MNTENIKQERQARMLDHFKDAKTDKSKLRLFSAVYYDRTETALELIDSNPEQINEKDPYAGLTPIHIAIYRQNKKVIRALTEHPQLEMQVKDNFGRRPVDMLDYTQNQEIFSMVMDAHSPDTAAELEEIRQEYIAEHGHDIGEDEGPEYIEETDLTPSTINNVVQIKPDVS